MQKLQVVSLDSISGNYEQALDTFLFRCKSLNLSPNSTRWYSHWLNDFKRFLLSLELESPSATTPQHIRAYLNSLQDRKLSSATTSRVYGALRVFFGYLVKESILAENPVTSIEKPKQVKKLIQPLSPEQVQALLLQPATKTFTGFRNWVMLLTFLDTGLRLSELLNLKTREIDWQNCCFRVLGKGAKERIVPFGSQVKKALLDYLQKRGNIEGQDILFVNQFGQNLNPRHIQIIFKRYGDKAGIKGVRVSPHTLRHTFAVSYLRAGGNAFSLQAVLGHSTLEMTRQYVAVSNSDLSVQHQKFSPIDRLGVLPNQKKQVVLK